MKKIKIGVVDQKIFFNDRNYYLEDWDQGFNKNFINYIEAIILPYKGGRWPLLVVPRGFGVLFKENIDNYEYFSFYNLQFNCWWCRIGDWKERVYED